MVAVVLNGKPYSLEKLSQQVPGIIEGWYLGQETGNAISGVLFGDTNPSGHLPVTIARNVGQLPVYYYKTPAARRGYVFHENTPLYPFGHGLSYTTFSFDNLKLTPTARTGDVIDVSVDVANTGRRAGDAVVQLYIHQRAGSASRPVRQLKGFERVALEPGAKRTLHFALGKDELQFWSPTGKKWVVEPEQFDVWVGENSNATLHGEFRLTE